MKKFIVKISPNTGIREGDYIIDPHYGLVKAMSNSSRGVYNQVTVKLIPKGTETTVSIFNGGGVVQNIPQWGWSWFWSRSKKGNTIFI